MPAGSVVAKVEGRLRVEGRKKGFKGKRLDRYVYGTLNKLKLKRGSRTTSKGARPA